MAPNRKGPPTKNGELDRLKSRLRVAEETIAAIHSGQVDAVMVSGELVSVGASDSGYRVFVEAMDEGAITVALDGTILYANRGFAELAKAAAEDVAGSNVFQFIEESDHTALEASMRAAQHAAVKLEVTLRRAQGERVPVFLSLKSFDGGESRVVSMVVTDLREQKRNEEIVAAGKLARAILQQAAEAIAVCDGTGRVLQASDALHELCGCNPLLQHFEEVLRLRVCDAEVAAMCSGAEAHERGRPFSLAEIMNGTTYRATEVTCRRPDGNVRHMLLSAAPLRLPNQGTGCVITLFDIEERKRAEEALRRSERLAATGRLAATIAHEINNPLESVTNLLFLIGAQPQIPKELKNYVELAQSELGRVAHITKQTLTFHRESNEPVPVSLGDLIDSVVYLHGQRVRDRQLSVLRELNFDGVIRGFPNELRQVISNLVANAIEASPQGARLRVRTYPAREWKSGGRRGVRIVVADQGAGITPAQRQRIFEPFYTTKGEKGTGLGLWVSQGIVLKHGGSIRMRSRTEREPRGTVFSVFLPAEQKQQSDRLHNGGAGLSKTA